MRRFQGEFVRKRRNDEALLQEMLCRWLDNKDILYVASLMGVNLGARIGAIRKRMGCRAGTPDLIILHPSGKYHGMTLELKIKGGHITNEQESFSIKASELNYYSVVMSPKYEIMDALEWAKKEIEYYIKGDTNESV